MVNSLLLGSGCPDCKVLRDNVFGLFARHHTPGSSIFSASQTTATQGTGSLFGEQLECGRQGTPGASQVFTVGEKFSPTAPRHLAVNPLARRRTASASPFRSLPSSERALYRGIKLDASSDSTFVPPVPKFKNKAGLFVGDWAVEGISSSPPDVNMSLGHWKTTECDGLGDSKHASSLPQELDAVDLVGSGSTDYGSMPPLPSTLAETVSRSRVSTMTSAGGGGSGGLDLMEQDAQVVEVVTADSPMAMGGGCNSEGSGLGDSRHATPVSDILGPDERLIMYRDGSYGGLHSVGLDVQYLGSVIGEMGLVIRRLEKRVE